MAAIKQADHTPDLQTQTPVLTEGKGEVKVDFRRQSSASNYYLSRNGRAPIGALANSVEIRNDHEKFNGRNMVDIPSIKFFTQRRYRANWPFVDGH
jgi:hypothetical protein